MKRKSISIILISVILATCLIAACNLNQTQNPDESSKTGELILGFSMDQNRTTVPGLSMEATEYIITGTSLKGGWFKVHSANPSTTVSKLIFDTWSVSIDAKNDTGIIIGNGTGTAIVHAGETTILNVSVTPLTGSGSVSLTADWEEAALEYPTIRSQLIPASGSPIDLDFTFGEVIAGIEPASYSNSLATGYHTVIIKLFDGNPAMTTPQLVAGVADVVRIVKDQLTSGIYHFKPNPLGGGIQVMISPDLANPIPVTMTGQRSTIAKGDVMTVTASVPAEVGNVTYVWYLNGESVDIGPSYVVNSSTSGVYNLSVTAFTADGTRGGSTNYQFTILDAMWNAVFDGTQSWTRTVLKNSNTTAPLYMDTVNKQLYSYSTYNGTYYSAVSFLTETADTVKPSYSSGRFYIGTMYQQSYYSSVSFNCFVDDSTIVYFDSATAMPRTQSGLSFVVHQNADATNNNHLYLFVYLNNSLLATVYNVSGLGTATPCYVKYKIEGDKLYAALWLASNTEPAYGSPVATINTEELAGRKFVIANGMYHTTSIYVGKTVAINSAHLENYINISEVSH